MDLIGKLLALASAMLWAAAVIFFKRAGEHLKPLALNLFKTGFTALLLLPIVLMQPKGMWPSWQQSPDWLIIAGSGILGIALADTLFFYSLNLLGASLTAIVECTYSPLVMAFSWSFLAEHPESVQLIGALLVIAAILIAGLRRDQHSRLRTGQLVWGIVVGITAMGLMAVSIVLMRPVLQKASFFWVAEVRQVAALIVMAIMVFFSSERQNLFAGLRLKKNRHFALTGTFLGNFLGMTCWVAAFKYTAVNSAAVLNQTTTVFIVVMASLILKEAFGLRQLVATALAVGGSILVLLG